MFPLRWNFPFRKKDGSLSTIQDELDNAGGGGGGGSEVEITPILTEGTKIATFEVDGEEGDLYAPTPSPGGGGTQLYYKDFTDIAFSGGWSAIATGSSWYQGESSTNINVDGYTPIEVTITDKYTGYFPFGSICKYGTSGTTYKLSVMAKKNSASESFNARIYYIANTDLTPIPNNSKTVKSKK